MLALNACGEGGLTRYGLRNMNFSTIGQSLWLTNRGLGVVIVRLSDPATFNEFSFLEVAKTLNK